MIECPERTNGKEFIEVAPYLAGKYFVAESFINSLVWRNQKAFLFNAKGYPEHTVSLINRIIKNKDTFYTLLNAFVTVKRVAQYIIRNPFSEQKMTYNEENGTVIYRSRTRPAVAMGRQGRRMRL
jgi:hypothetical protein